MARLLKSGTDIGSDSEEERLLSSLPKSSSTPGVGQAGATAGGQSSIPTSAPAQSSQRGSSTPGKKTTIKIRTTPRGTGGRPASAGPENKGEKKRAPASSENKGERKKRRSEPGPSTEKTSGQTSAKSTATAPSMIPAGGGSAGTSLPSPPMMSPPSTSQMPRVPRVGKAPTDPPEFRALPIHQSIKKSAEAMIAVRDDAISMAVELDKGRKALKEKIEEVESLAREKESLVREKAGLIEERDEALELAAQSARKLEESAQAAHKWESEANTLRSELERLQKSDSELRTQLLSKDQELDSKAAAAVEEFQGSQEFRDLMDSRAALWSELTTRELRKIVIKNFGQRFSLTPEDFSFIRAADIADIVERKVEQRMAQAARQEESRAPAGEGSSRGASGAKD
jgi:hypothetical protein